MNTKKTNQVLIDLDNVTLRFGEMEPVVIPRSVVRTRVRLIDCVYRLTGWPGMKVQYLREFIAAIYRHHGWSLPDLKDDPILKTGPPAGGKVEPRNNGWPSLTDTAYRDSAGFQPAIWTGSSRGELAA